MSELRRKINGNLFEIELSQRNTGRVIHIIKKYMKIKGDMLVMENISRKKNYRDFEVLEKFINEY